MPCCECHQSSLLAAEAALAQAREERDGLIALLDRGCDCPIHGKWMDRENGYAVCGKCHDEVKAERDAALATVERMRTALKEARPYVLLAYDDYDRKKEGLARIDAALVPAESEGEKEKG